jgi:hypothetical protein
LYNAEFAQGVVVMVSHLHRILAGEAIQMLKGGSLPCYGTLLSIFVRLLHCHIWTEFIIAGLVWDLDES